MRFSAKARGPFDAVLGVLGAAPPVVVALDGLLEGEGEALVGGLLGPANGEGGAGEDLVRPLLGGREELGERDDLVDEAALLRLLGSDVSGP